MKIIYDLFPAKITLSDATGKVHRTVEAVRLVITEDTIFIAGDSHKGPTLIFREKYSTEDLQLDKSRDADSRVTTINGKVLVFKKDQNCGCGSKLRSWNPYNTVYSSKDPTE